MRTRDKVAICRRFKAGEPVMTLGLELWVGGKINGALADCDLAVEAVIREAMNGAKWWRPTGKDSLQVREGKP